MPWCCCSGLDAANDHPAELLGLGAMDRSPTIGASTAVLMRIGVPPGQGEPSTPELDSLDPSATAGDGLPSAGMVIELPRLRPR